MKRSAESQLTRENLDTEDDSASDGPREFQRAAPKELAKRVIKPLPNRRGGSGSPAPSSAPTGPSAQGIKPSSTPVTTSASTSLPTLDPIKLPPIPTGSFTFKPPTTTGSSTFSFPSASSGGASKPTLPSFTGFGSSGAAAGPGSGFSFNLSTPAQKEAAPESSASGTKSSKPSSGGLPPFNPPLSSSTSLPSFGTKQPGTAHAPKAAASTPSFTFGNPQSDKTGSAASKTPSMSTSASKPSIPNTSHAPVGSKTSSANMTATAKTMSSIFSSMSSESPPRPSLPGFKGPGGGIAISPEKGSTSGKDKTGSFSFGGGIPKKPVANEAQSKSKADKGKGKATTSTGTFGLGRSSPSQSPIEEEVEDDQAPYSPNGPFPNGPSPNEPNGDYHFEQLPGGLDAGDFDPSLNEDGTPSRKPHYHPDHQEAYKNDPELKYWLHLRGLNTSFLREVIRMQREDAFIDMSGIFKSYKEFRKNIIKDMVDYLRANGKGEGTESAGEDSDSEDEEMYYDEGEAEEVHMMEEEDETNDIYLKSRAQEAAQQKAAMEDKEKTPPAGLRPPTAPVGGFYIFGGKPVSSFTGASTTGGGFKPTGAAAGFEPPPPARYTFKQPPKSTPQGSSPTTTSPTSKATGAKEPAKSGFTFKPAALSSTFAAPSPLPAPTGPTLGFTPLADGTSGSTASKPSTGSSSAFGGFTPSFGSSSTSSVPPSSTGSGFSFPPSSSSFSFGKPPTAVSASGAPKEADSSPKSLPATTPAKTSTFPGFGPITGGPSGSPFGTKSTAGDSSVSPAAPPIFGFRPDNGKTPFAGFGGASGTGDSGGSSAAPKAGLFGSIGDIGKSNLIFGAKPTHSWPPSTPETAKPDGVFGAPPASAGASLFGSTSGTGPSPQSGSLFGSSGIAPSAFGSGSTSAFGSAGSSSAFGGNASAFSAANSSGTAASSFFAASSGDPTKSPRTESSSKPDESKDELEGDDEESTTPRAKPKDLSAPEAAAPARLGIANPWAKGPAASSIAPAPGGPFTFGMGSKPAAPEITPSKPTGFSFADPPSSFKLPSAGAFSFADPPKSVAAGSSNTFTNPFASPPKAGSLFSFGSGSGGFGGAATSSGSAPTAAPLFGGSTGGSFSFGAPSTLPKGPFFPSTATSGSSQETGVAASIGGFEGSGARSSSGAGTSGSSAPAGSSQDSDVAPETGLALGEDKFDQPGPGEEMEENLFNVRGKVLKFSENKWVDLGIGQIRLYKHKETGAKRVFARNSKSGRILLNFAPFNKMEPKVDDQNAKFMRMTGMDDGKLVKILVKLKEKSDATELVGVLQKEVEVLS